MALAQLGKDPLTWTFAKLFGCHVRDLRALEGLPGSHSWRWQTNGLWHARVLTKAQCCGVVVSVAERAERVEFLVDDGTELVKAALWGERLRAPVALGDLVHVEGKLNEDRNWDNVQPTRELRVLRIARIDDPNEELLHWAQVMELAQTFYSAAERPRAELDVEEIRWDDVASEAFFELGVSAATKERLLSRGDYNVNDNTLVETLEGFLRQQKQDEAQPLRVKFGDHVTAGDSTKEKAQQDALNKTVRSLQYVFKKLRRAGLLFLEDEFEDCYVLLSFELVLKPALLQLLREQPKGISLPDIADALLAQHRFQWTPLPWIERGLQHLLSSRLAVQHEDSQLFFIAA